MCACVFEEPLACAMVPTRLSPFCWGRDSWRLSAVESNSVVVGCCYRPCIIRALPHSLTRLISPKSKTRQSKDQAVAALNTQLKAEVRAREGVEGQLASIERKVVELQASVERLGQERQDTERRYISSSKPWSHTTVTGGGRCLDSIGDFLCL